MGLAQRDLARVTITLIAYNVAQIAKSKVAARLKARGIRKLLQELNRQFGFGVRQSLFLLLALSLSCSLKNLLFSWVASPLSFRSGSVALIRDPHYPICL